MKKLILIVMLTMLTACSDNSFDGIYVGKSLSTPYISSTITLTVTGDKATMLDSLGGAIKTLEATVSDDTLAITYPSKTFYFTFTDDKKALNCKDCLIKLWVKMENEKKHEDEIEKGDSFFQRLIDLFE